MAARRRALSAMPKKTAATASKIMIIQVIGARAVNKRSADPLGARRLRETWPAARPVTARNARFYPAADGPRSAFPVPPQRGTAAGENVTAVGVRASTSSAAAERIHSIDQTLTRRAGAIGHAP
jgi:hypothetical protein